MAENLFPEALEATCCKCNEGAMDIGAGASTWLVVYLLPAFSIESNQSYQHGIIYYGDYYYYSII